MKKTLLPTDIFAPSWAHNHHGAEALGWRRGWCWPIKQQSRPQSPRYNQRCTRERGLWKRDCQVKHAKIVASTMAGHGCEMVNSHSRCQTRGFTPTGQASCH